MNAKSQARESAGASLVVILAISVAVAVALGYGSSIIARPEVDRPNVFAGGMLHPFAESRTEFVYSSAFSREPQAWETGNFRSGRDAARSPRV
jgi:hypothetical protein